MISDQAPMGIYIHVPFCLRKCDYCDFYSIGLSNQEMLETYTHSLVLELRRRREEFPFPFNTIFLGGGTPSLLKPQQIETIIDTVFAHYPAAGQPEISLEANPATVNLQGMKDLRSAGINRLSIGVQSFSDSELRLLGRMHDSKEAEEALANAFRAGFTNVNADLIYGIPGQQARDWESSLTRLQKYQPPHLSMYLLQLESSTPMGRKINEGKLPAEDEDLESRLYYKALEFLRARGYHHYEISNLAQPGLECRHNLIYWQAGRYLGIGCGAVSFDGRQRILNQPPVEKYIADLMAGRCTAVEILETMNLQQRLVDALILGLRLIDGINVEDFNHRFDINIKDLFKEAINTSCEEGLLAEHGGRLYLTPRAYFLSNQVFSRFIS